MRPSRLSVPAQASKGEVFEIRFLVQHPMENGFRRDAQGRVIPSNVVKQVVARYAGREIFRAELGTGIAANPYLAFYTTATQSGAIEIEWVDEQGERGQASAVLNVV